MGASHTNSTYRDPNLVVEYYFSLNKPSSSSQPSISEQIGASLHELEPLEQAQVCRELKHIITTTKPEMVSEYNKFQRINVITKILISIVTTTCLGYIGGAIMGYLPSLKLIWLLICTLTFILWMSLAIYILYFTKKTTAKWLYRWRSSIMAQISTQTVEWQKKSKSFTFSVYYPIIETQQVQLIKSKSTNKSYGGIVRVTLGMPKSQNTKQAVYFQVTPKESVIAKKPWKYYQTSDSSDDEMDGEQDEEAQDEMTDTRRHSMYRRGRREHRRTATDELLLIANGENTLDNIKPILDNQTMSDIICDPHPYTDHDHDAPQIGITYNYEQQFAKVMMEDVEHDWNLDECKFVDNYYGDLYNEDQVELAIEGDDDEYDDGEYDGNNQYMRCKTLPIMIHDKNGPKILLKGIRTIFNGKEAILIDDAGNVADAMSVRSVQKKRRNSMPISPVQPDLLYDDEENIVLPMVGTAVFTAIQSEL